jgi:hypothetical protein
MFDEYVCPITPNPEHRAYKPCDGSANAYHRHVQRGEPACQQSKNSLAFAKRRSRRTALWHGKLSVLDTEEDLYRTLLTPEDWDRYEATVQIKRMVRPERFRHEVFYAEPEAPTDE